MRLDTHWRSTTSYRDRIALNPGQGLPTLVPGDGTALTQSMAIRCDLKETS